MIIYFTGTGNSEYIGKNLSKLLDDEVVCGNDYIKNNEAGNFYSDKAYIFVGPVYAWRLARVFRDFIDRSNFLGEGTKRCYFLLNAGSSVGGAKTDILYLCHKKNFNFMGLTAIIMPENYIAMFNPPSDEKIKKLFDKADIKIQKLAEAVKKQEIADNVSSMPAGKLMTAFVNPFFYKFIISDKDFKVDDKCISCGLCVKKCPLNNIKLVDKKPNWLGSCTHCMACISHCPTEAINYGQKTAKKKRYRADKYKKY